MADGIESSGRTPVGIILVCLLLIVYGLFWMLTWFLAGIIGNGLVAVLSVSIAVGFLLLAYFLYRGSRTAWLITLVFIGGSTFWRLSLVVAGETDNLVNTVVGVILVLYLISQHEFYRPIHS